MSLKFSLIQYNRIVFGIIVLVNGYIIAAPLIPQADFWWQSHHGHSQETLNRKIVTLKSAPSSAADGAKQTTTQPQANQVIIPSMLLDQTLLEGKDTYAILNHGVWHWPYGSSPDRGGNTVLIGHRFTYTNPRGVFYHLDKVALGDTIAIVWNNKTYQYTVSNIAVVSPSDTSIENATSDARLTIFTCTPLWLPKDRLVVTAELDS